MYDPEKHHRKSIRLKQYDYSSQGAYFITLVTQNREDFFGEIVQGEMILSKMGKIAHNNWLEISNHFENVILDEFVIMPNHVHCVIFLKEVKKDVKFYALTEEKTVHSNSNSNFDDVTLHNLTREENSNSNYNCGGVKLYAQNEQQQTTLVNQKNNYFSNLAPKKNTISSIIRAYKASVTSNCKKNNYHEFQWQRNYYEHIIRNERALNNIRKYINENPMKWNLDRENEKSEFEKHKFKSIQEINNFDIKNDI